MSKHISASDIFSKKVEPKKTGGWFKYVAYTLPLLLAGIVLVTLLSNYSMSIIGITFIKSFLFLSPDKVKNDNGIINVLIMGKGGKGHEAPELTDTIMVASISPNAKRINLISIPRDIWVFDLSAKLNSVYSWGNKKSESGGISLAKSKVEEILGIPIHYGIVLDFSGLKNIVDSIGGIEVDVKNAFVDEKYPIVGLENDDCDGDPEYRCRYETLAFEKGKTKMNGELVLKFVRSRNAVGEEGTDFSRAARQQLVIYAIKDRLLSLEVLTSPSIINSLYNSGIALIETDLTLEEAGFLSRRVLLSKNDIRNLLLPENLLEVPQKSDVFANLYVYIPKKVSDTNAGGRSWDEIKLWVKCVTESDNCS